jgi:hypothetical protein
MFIQADDLKKLPRLAPAAFLLLETGSASVSPYAAAARAADVSGSPPTYVS